MPTSSGFATFYRRPVENHVLQECAPHRQASASLGANRLQKGCMQIVRNRFVETLGSPDRGQRLVRMLALHGFGALQFVDV
jgi:hypothetical protein